MKNKVNDCQTKTSFLVYLEKHPEERFWQAIRNWSKHAFVLVADDINMHNVEDTYNFRGKSRGK